MLDLFIQTKSLKFLYYLWQLYHLLLGYFLEELHKRLKLDGLL